MGLHLHLSLGGHFPGDSQAAHFILNLWRRRVALWSWRLDLAEPFIFLPGWCRNNVIPLGWRSTRNVPGFCINPERMVCMFSMWKCSFRVVVIFFYHFFPVRDIYLYINYFPLEQRNILPTETPIFYTKAGYSGYKMVGLTNAPISFQHTALALQALQEESVWGESPDLGRIQGSGSTFLCP